MNKINIIYMNVSGNVTIKNTWYCLLGVHSWKAYLTELEVLFYITNNKMTEQITKIVLQSEMILGSFPASAPGIMLGLLNEKLLYK